MLKVIDKGSLQAPADLWTLGDPLLTASVSGNVLSGWAFNFVTTPSIALTQPSLPSGQDQLRRENLRTFRLRGKAPPEMARIIHGQEQDPWK